MEMLKNLMETITGMGATAILPLVIFILGLVFRMKPKPRSSRASQSVLVLLV